MLKADNRRRNVSVVKVKGNQVERVDDPVAEEKRYELVINGQHAMTFACSPGGEKALVLGYLMNEGKISHMSDVSSVEIQEDCLVVQINNRRPGNEAVQKQALPTEPMLTPEALHRFFDDMHTHMALFEETGGVHSGALYDHTGMHRFVTDVARHNVLDRLRGEMLLADRPTKGLVLTFSGRLAYEIVRKAAAMKVAVLAGISAPTSAGIACAEEAGLTLIGFVRGKRMNIYTHPERIRLPQDSGEEKTGRPTPHLITVTAPASGSGKTTFIEKLLPHFIEAGLRVGVLKRSNHAFSPGASDKDSWRYWAAGAEAVLYEGTDERVLVTGREGADKGLDLMAAAANLDLIIVESRNARYGEVYHVVRGAEHAKSFTASPEATNHHVVTDEPMLFPDRTTLPLNDAKASALEIMADIGRNV